MSIFNISEFVETIGTKFITDFNAASNRTHPVAIGEAREAALKCAFENILPSGIGVSSGFIVDYEGNTSCQCDIIIYEYNNSLRFIQNKDEKNQYINAESIIAVGEVKSDASIVDLNNTISKIKRLNTLKRTSEYFRLFFSNLPIAGSEEELFNPMVNDFDNIFTFFISKTLSLNFDNFVDTLIQTSQNKYDYISSIISLDGKNIFYAKNNNGKNEMCSGPLSADYIVFQDDYPTPFSFLLYKIIERIQKGRCPQLNYTKYLVQSISNIERNSIFKKI